MSVRARAALLALPFAAACSTGAELLPQDTSTSGCDRVHGATGVILVTDAGNTQHFPTEAPSDTLATTTVAGPLADGTWLAVSGNEVLASDDGGCNWQSAGGRLPSGGVWDLVTVGATAYAFDRGGAQVGISGDGGLSWTAADAGEPFIGSVRADSTGRLRGVQARGLVTSEDGGQTWTPSGTPPPGAPAGAAVFPGDLDVAAVTYSGGVAITRNGGTSWDDLGAELVVDGFIGHSVDFASDSADILWVGGEDPEQSVIHRTVDAGAHWTDVATSKSLDLDADAPIWPVPGMPNEALAAYGSSEDNFGISVYHIIAGDSLHTTHTGGTYFHVNDAAFTEDGSWLVAVDGVQ